MMADTVPVLQMNGFGPPDSKPPKKRVSFTDTVTDIVTDIDDSFVSDEDEARELENIFSITEKIQFFNQSSMGRPDRACSIPEARMAFVAGMVGRTRAERGVTEHEPLALPTQPKTEEDMEFSASRVFAVPKRPLTQETAVDSSSILEHREELRDLWEKRMMADDQPSSTSAAKPETEVDAEEQVVKKVEDTTPATTEEHALDLKTIDSESPHKTSNGYLEQNGNDIIITPGNDVKVISASDDVVISGKDVTETEKADLENNNSADSLDEDEDIVKPSAELKVEVVPVKEEIVDSTTSALDKTESATIQVEEIVSITTCPDVSEKEGTESSDEVHHQEEDQSEAEGQQQVAVEADHTVETREREIPRDEVEVAVVGLDQTVEEEIEESSVAASEELLWEEIETNDKIEGEEEDRHEEKSLIEQVQQIEESTTPRAPLVDEKNRVAALANGGLKRVKQTEYDSCTTETKIAMEIREMREREEELRVMRERALESPLPTKGPTPPLVVRTPSPSPKELPVSGPGYRVSSVFGHKGSTPSPTPADDEKKVLFGFSKESQVEKEIRLARDREEELRKQQGLPPREDDSYVKPSQVKSSQVRVFGKVTSSPKQAATAKIQMEIEEQTQREVALRDTGHIRTISTERTDERVARLADSSATNGDHHSYSNGHSSPDLGPPKRGSPSPTGNGPRSLPLTNGRNGVSMHKFIASRGKESAFAPPTVKLNGKGEEPRSLVPPTTVKLKRTVSVESKIQQEIVEMKQREEELRKLHMNRNHENGSHENGNGIELDLVMINKNNNIVENYDNGLNEEDINPRHNKLIAQWEQRIQKAES